MQEFGPNGPDKLRGNVSFQSTNIEGGCGRIFDTDNGAYLEYTLGVLDKNTGTLEVFGVPLSDNIYIQFGHILVAGWLDLMLRTLGRRREVWMKKAKGTLEQRAECILDIATVFGWSIIDDEPHEYSKAELAARWFEEFRSEGPVTTAKLGDFPLLCSELLIALHSVDPDKYWTLMSSHFPVIPSEALNNYQSNWWPQHGKAAVAKIVSVIGQVCPPRFHFSFKEGRFGFWEKG